MTRRYNNYVKYFNEGNFIFEMTLEEFKTKDFVEYTCSNGHHNKMNLTSFNNKKSKYKTEYYKMCSTCIKQDVSNDKLEEINEKIKDTGHIVLEYVNNKDIKYKCGNCGVISKSNTLSFSRNRSKYCNRCQNVNNRNEWSKIKEIVEKRGLTLLNDEGDIINNKQKMDLLCICGEKYSSNLANIVRGRNCYNCKLNKYEKTCIERYGVRNVSQDSAIMDKINKSLTSSKEYIFPSGKKVYVRGAEPDALDLLLGNGFEEEDIVVENVPTFKYIYLDKSRIYFPDIYIKSLDLFIEVKSPYVFNFDPKKVYIKGRTVIEKGHNFKLMMFGDTNNLVDIWTFDINGEYSNVFGKDIICNSNIDKKIYKGRGKTIELII